MTTTLALAGFTFAGVSATIRLLIGPSLADRVAALDVALVSVMGGIVVYAADRGSSTLLVLLVVMAIIGLTATVAAARFIERQDARP